MDLNKVGQITIIVMTIRLKSSGTLKRVIYGTVVANPYEIGYESIRSLVEIKKIRTTSDYVDTGARVVTVNNIGDYMLTQNRNAGEDQEKP